MAENGGGPRAVFIDAVVADIIQRYRIDPDRAGTRIADLLAGRPALLAALDAPAATVAAVRRRRDAREFVKAARKAVYYDLRRYHHDAAGDDDPVAALAALPDDAAAAAVAPLVGAITARHISTRERLPDLAGFHAVLLPLLAEAATVVDIGAGVLPLLLPFERLPRLHCWLALDRDAAAVAAVTAAARFVAPGRLAARHWSLGEPWPTPPAGGGPADEERSGFDIALALKVVPVVERQAPARLADLAAAPAMRWVVSGARQSMTRRHDIAGRERRSLERFAAQAGMTAGGQWETRDEIGLVLRPGRGR